MSADADKVNEALGLCRSIAQAGERWSEQAQRTWDEGLAALGRLAAAEADCEKRIAEVGAGGSKAARILGNELMGKLVAAEARAETLAEALRRISQARGVQRPSVLKSWAREALAAVTLTEAAHGEG